MSEQSAKPYLIRAICEWCADNGLTPYLAVKVNGQTRVPMAFVCNGEIVLNISANATRKLTIDNDWVNFNARFGGVSQEVAVPIGAVAGIFAKETGYGFAFQPVGDAATAPEQTAAPEVIDIDAALDADAKEATDAKSTRKPRSRPSHLQVIK
jgi:stringent starvation protein B